jgi:hypothetical protein
MQNLLEELMRSVTFFKLGGLPARCRGYEGGVYMYDVDNTGT